MQNLIQDATLRAQFEADLPRLTNAWFDDVADVPEWARLRCGYLKLSDGYAAEAASARRLSWPVVEIDGTHLHPTIAAEQTADALIEIIATVDHYN